MAGSSSHEITRGHEEEGHKHDHGVKRIMKGIHNFLTHGHDHDHHKNECNSSDGFDAVQRIITGFNNFLNQDYRRNPEKFKDLAKTQKPKFLVFSCSDSRVSPSHIIDFQLGEAFGARNISALIPTSDKVAFSDVGATIEYAVKDLKVENILVIGHSKCGGITRLMKYPGDGSEPLEYVDKWMSIAQPAKSMVTKKYGHLSMDEQINLCVQESVNVSLRNLQSYPFVQKAVKEGKLALRGAYYDFQHPGSLKLWEFKSSIMTPPIIIN